MALGRDNQTAVFDESERWLVGYEGHTEANGDSPKEALKCAKEAPPAMLPVTAVLWIRIIKSAAGLVIVLEIHQDT